MTGPNFASLRMFRRTSSVLRPLSRSQARLSNSQQQCQQHTDARSDVTVSPQSVSYIPPINSVSAATFKPSVLAKRKPGMKSSSGSASPSSPASKSAPSIDPIVTRLAAVSGPVYRLVNPPECARPPPLNLPIPLPGQSKATTLLAKGRSYLAFYKQGVKNVVGLIRTGRSIKKTHSAETPSSASSLFSRAELEVLVRAAEARRTLPIFALFLLLAGEWLPVVVTFITPLVPRPCLLPAQVVSTQANYTLARSRITASWPFPTSPASTIRTRVKQLSSTSSASKPTSFFSAKSTFESTLLATYLGCMSRRWARFLDPHGRESSISTVRTLIAALFFPSARLNKAIKTIHNSDAAFLRAADAVVPSIKSEQPTVDDKIVRKLAIQTAVHALVSAELLDAAMARGLTVSENSSHPVAQPDEMRRFLVDWLSDMDSHHHRDS